MHDNSNETQNGKLKQQETKEIENKDESLKKQEMN